MESSFTKSGYGLFSVVAEREGEDLLAVIQDSKDFTKDFLEPAIEDVSKNFKQAVDETEKSEYSMKLAREYAVQNVFKDHTNPICTALKQEFSQRARNTALFVCFVDNDILKSIWNVTAEEKRKMKFLQMKLGLTTFHTSYFQTPLPERMSQLLSWQRNLFICRGHYSRG